MANHFLRRQANWEELYFYKKTDVLYQLTFAFTKRFLKMGDRTIDQMVQAARSGKQNIAEGCADGVSSTEMEIKLINVARASIKELKEDYEDYLIARQLSKWDEGHPRFNSLLDFCRQHNDEKDYNDMYSKASDEELANLAITLCRQVDKMIITYLAQLEQTFVEEGGIKERTTAARQGRRQTQNEIIEAQAHEIELLKKRINHLEEQLRQRNR